MRLAFLELNGFRGYRKPLRIEFADRFTVIDGRNGVGKSTLFDAIEFALTGVLGKYDDQKAAGETVADYIWWRGEGPAPVDRYVQVGFRDDEGEISVVRREFESPDEIALRALERRLCDERLAPAASLSQLCASSIIRDEHITKLSLDLRETDRYALLRDALGAIDSDAWIERGAQLISAARRRSVVAQQEVTLANADVAAAARRLDEVRANLIADNVMADAVSRLQVFANTTTPPDQLVSPVRERIAAVVTEIASLRDLVDLWTNVQTERSRIPDLSRSLDAVKAEKQLAVSTLEALPAVSAFIPASALADQARDLINLVALGRKFDLRDGHCPLCAKGQSHEEYERGLVQAESAARLINENAVRAAQQEQSRAAAEARLAAASRALQAAEAAHANALETIRRFDQRRAALGLSVDATLDEVRVRMAQLGQILETAQRDLRVLETLRLSAELERAHRAEADAAARLTRAQERFGRTRKAENSAQALHDAARRAASETLDQRLERVLPLMSELYRRLRPHPVWSDIEYSIRGDVRRFLKLQVGEALNPQFLFSSGQRRATGLAFLLSVNLSLTWSKWRSILLDDPVQHVDDFRTVHLAELLAQLVAEGRQVICAVEDAALADLLCRRLPVGRHGAAKRITLGSDTEGALAKVHERPLVPLVQNSLAPMPGTSTA